jgi:hypothetical protein
LLFLMNKKLVYSKRGMRFDIKYCINRKNIFLDICDSYAL